MIPDTLALIVIQLLLYDCKENWIESTIDERTAVPTEGTVKG